MKLVEIEVLCKAQEKTLICTDQSVSLSLPFNLCLGSGFLRIRFDFTPWIWIHIDLYFLYTDPDLYWEYGSGSR